MNADTETNVDTARTRAERLIQEGAHVLVGAFDSGATAAIAQVAEQRGVPFVINIAAAPQITEQGYKFVFRNFPTAIDLGRNGLALIGDLFRATNVAPRTAVFMHVNDTFGQAMTKGISGAAAAADALPFKIVDTISYDPAAKDLTVEVSKAKAAERRLPAAGLPPERRDRPAPRDGEAALEPDGHRQPGLARPVRGAVHQGARQVRRVLHLATRVWFNPKTDDDARSSRRRSTSRIPKDELVFHGINVGYTFEAILIAADAFKRARHAPIRRRWPTRSARPTSRRPIACRSAGRSSSTPRARSRATARS